MASHYKLTEARRDAIRKAITDVLKRRPTMQFNAMSITGDTLQRLAYSDWELSALDRAANLYPHGVARFRSATTTFQFEQCTVVVMWHTPPDDEFFWPSNRVPYSRFVSSDWVYRRTAGAEQLRDCTLRIDPARYEDPQRHEVATQLREWAAQTYTVMRRYELGLQIVEEIFTKTSLLTSIVATLPDLKTIMAKDKDLLREMEKVPRRTLGNYRLSIDPKRLHALRHLVAEGLVLPEDLPNNPCISHAVYIPTEALLEKERQAA